MIVRTVTIYDQIFWLDVPMENVPRMKVLQSLYEARDKEPYNEAKLNQIIHPHDLRVHSIEDVNRRALLINRKLTSHIFIETLAIPADVVTKVTPAQVVHDQVQVLPVLKRIVHVDEERVLQAGQDVPLVHDRFHAAFSDNSGLAHFFEGEVRALFFAFHAPDFAKAALTNAEVIHKVRFTNG